MDYRKIAREKLSKLIDKQSGKPPIQESMCEYSRVIEMITSELGIEELFPLLDFINEYNGSFECSFGFLFDPYLGINNPRPLLQKSNNPKSQYFCAKLPIKGMGNVYVIPLEKNTVQEFAIVLKPDRVLRRSVKVQKTTIVGTNVSVIFEPYSEIFEKLTSWAVIYEANLRKTE